MCVLDIIPQLFPRKYDELCHSAQACCYGYKQWTVRYAWSTNLWDVTAHTTGNSPKTPKIFYFRDLRCFCFFSFGYLCMHAKIFKFSCKKAFAFHYFLKGFGSKSHITRENLFFSYLQTMFLQKED